MQRKRKLDWVEDILHVILFGGLVLAFAVSVRHSYRENYGNLQGTSPFLRLKRSAKVSWSSYLDSSPPSSRSEGTVISTYPPPEKNPSQSQSQTETQTQTPTESKGKFYSQNQEKDSSSTSDGSPPSEEEASEEVLRSNPLVSIIVPVYNSEKLLPRSLSSILESSEFLFENVPRAHVEVILVDDSSTDSSTTLIQEICFQSPSWLALKTSERLSVHFSSNPKNLGSALSRNKGLSLISNSKEFSSHALFFLDSDDHYLPNHLAACLLNLLHNNLRDPSVTFARTEALYDDPIHSDWTAAIENSLLLNLCVLRSAHDFVGGLSESALLVNSEGRGGGEDFYYARLLAHFFKGVKVPLQTVHYHRYPNSNYDKQLPKFLKPREQEMNYVSQKEIKEHQQINDLFQEHTLKLTQQITSNASLYQRNPPLRKILQAFVDYKHLSFPNPNPEEEKEKEIENEEGNENTNESEKEKEKEKENEQRRKGTEEKEKEKRRKGEKEKGKGKGRGRAKSRREGPGLPALTGSQKAFVEKQISQIRSRSRKGLSVISAVKLTAYCGAIRESSCHEEALSKLREKKWKPFEIEREASKILAHLFRTVS